MTDRRDRSEKVTETCLRTTRQHCENWINPANECVLRRPDLERKDTIGFKGGIGATKLPDLTAARVIKFRDDMRKHGAGVVTTSSVLGTLSRILKHAVESDLAPINVATGVRVIGTRDEDGEKVTPPYKPDIAKLLAKAEGSAKIGVTFAATTGLRASEQWALQWKHIDLDKAAVKVEQHLDAFDGIDVTKSAAGKPTVPPNTPTHQAPMETAGECGRDQAFGWHSLRHYAVSTWIEAGLQPKAVQPLAGHASSATTMNGYGHPFPSDSHHEAFDKLAEALA